MSAQTGANDRPQTVCGPPAFLDMAIVSGVVKGQLGLHREKSRKASMGSARVADIAVLSMPCQVYKYTSSGAVVTSRYT